MQEWKRLKLGDLLEEYTERNENQKYKPVAIGKYGIRMREDIYSKELSQDISKNKLIRKDTLTIGMGSTQIDIGILINDIIYSVSPAYTTYKIKNCNSKFLDYYLKLKNSKISDLFMIVSARQGKSVDKSGLLKYQLSIPKVEEQEKIVEILLKVDNLINKIEQHISLTEKQMSGFIKDVYKNTEKLRKIKIKDYLETISDYHANGSYEKLKENVKLLSDKNYAIMIRTLNLSQSDFKDNLLYIDESAYNFLNKSKVFPDDILMNKIANPGSIYIIPDLKYPVSCGMNLFLIRFSEKMNQRYMYYNMKNVEENIKKLAHGSTTKTITKDEVKNFELYIHSKSEQDKLENIFTNFEKRINLLNSKKQEYEKFKKGLMQKLLTGEIRVK